MRNVAGERPTKDIIRVDEVDEVFDTDDCCDARTARC
jgi:hypothetical protein